MISRRSTGLLPRQKSISFSTQGEFAASGEAGKMNHSAEPRACSIVGHSAGFADRLA
jgi:hypothetical protein